ncbi:MAG: uroporphyrinogen III synthase HEM4 [Alteromonadaceae bacterium]|nr:MAG: uroporphyrinogen III synthase HEM4 [Alteromonadaceae bacterium]
MTEEHTGEALQKSAEQEGGDPLGHWRIAVPESRELDLFSEMLTQRGAEVLRCPLIAIYDSPDVESIANWLTQFIEQDFDDIIMLTGEGIRRLTKFAERQGIKEAWIDALSRVRKIARGPKPGRALREVKLKPDTIAKMATTEGIIDMLSTEDLSGRKIAVQLYGDVVNERLQGFLTEQGAQVSAVAPYIYAPDSENGDVEALITQVIEGQLDVFVFTSTPQITRVVKIAKKGERLEAFIDGLNRMVVAAIGPVAAAGLEAQGIEVKISPDERFFMKPLVRKLVEYVAKNGK